MKPVLSPVRFSYEVYSRHSQALIHRSAHEHCETSVTLCGHVCAYSRFSRAERNCIVAPAAA